MPRLSIRPLAHLVHHLTGWCRRDRSWGELSAFVHRTYGDAELPTLASLVQRFHRDGEQTALAALVDRVQGEQTCARLARFWDRVQRDRDWPRLRRALDRVAQDIELPDLPVTLSPQYRQVLRGALLLGVVLHGAPAVTNSTLRRTAEDGVLTAAKIGLAQDVHAARLLALWRGQDDGAPQTAATVAAATPPASWGAADAGVTRTPGPGRAAAPGDSPAASALGPRAPPTALV